MYSSIQCRISGVTLKLLNVTEAYTVIRLKSKQNETKLKRTVMHFPKNNVTCRILKFAVQLVFLNIFHCYLTHNVYNYIHKYLSK